MFFEDVARLSIRQPGAAAQVPKAHFDIFPASSGHGDPVRYSGTKPNDLIRAGSHRIAVVFSVCYQGPRADHLIHRVPAAFPNTLIVGSFVTS